MHIYNEIYIKYKKTERLEAISVIFEVEKKIVDSWYYPVNCNPISSALFFFIAISGQEGTQLKFILISHSKKNMEDEYYVDSLNNYFSGQYWPK